MEIIFVYTFFDKCEPIDSYLQMIEISIRKWRSRGGMASYLEENHPLAHKNSP